jgi:hypothetical protein
VNVVRLVIARGDPDVPTRGDVLHCDHEYNHSRVTKHAHRHGVPLLIGVHTLRPFTGTGGLSHARLQTRNT